MKEPPKGKDQDKRDTKLSVSDRYAVFITIIIIILILVIHALKYDPYVYDVEEFGEGHVNVVNDDYWIDIVSMKAIRIKNVRYSFMDENGTVNLDTNGEPLSGKIIPITAQEHEDNQSFFESPTDTLPLNATDPNEPYYYVVFLDKDDNGFVNAGDVFYVKGKDNGGLGEEDDIFRIKNARTGKIDWEVELPVA